MSLLRIDQFSDIGASVPADAIVLFEINPANAGTRDYRKGTLASLVALAGLATASGLTMSTARMLGRTTAATGALEEMDAAAVKTFLTLTDMGRSVQVRASGTAYTLTNVNALLDFGTQDPSIVLDRAGDWLIIAFAQYQAQAATFAAARTVTTNVRRVNNTAANLANGAAMAIAPIMTTATQTITANIPPFVYTTANTDDNLQLFGDVSTVPTAGTLDAVRASMVAVLLRPTGF